MKNFKKYLIILCFSTNAIFAYSQLEIVKLIPPAPTPGTSAMLSIFYSVYYRVILEDNSQLKADQMILYPNPSVDDEEIGIKLPENGSEKGTLYIYSLEGQLIQSIQYQNRTAQINGGILKKGTYHVIDGESKIIRKIQKI